MTALHYYIKASTLCAMSPSLTNTSYRNNLHEMIDDGKYQSNGAKDDSNDGEFLVDGVRHGLRTSVAITLSHD